MARILTAGVLAGAYRGKRRDLADIRTHSVDERTMVPLCKSVKPEHLTFDGGEHEQPTCKRCRKLDPRMPQHANDGPFSLKTLLQF